jgi:hypothetical protein
MRNIVTPESTYAEYNNDTKASEMDLVRGELHVTNDVTVNTVTSRRSWNVQVTVDSSP